MSELYLAGTVILIVFAPIMAFQIGAQVKPMFPPLTPRNALILNLAVLSYYIFKLYKGG